MKKTTLSIIKSSLAAFLILSMVLQAAAPTIAFAAADYKAGLTLCSGGVYVPKGTQCPDPSDWGYFICMAAASVAALGVAALFAWNPPWALVIFASIFAGGAAICPHTPPPAPNLTVSGVAIASGGLPNLGNIVAFKSTIKNTGKVATVSSFSNRFEYRWGTSGSWSALDTVVSNGVYNGGSDTLVSKTFALNKSSTLQLRVCADSGNVVVESNEKDNCSNPLSGQFIVSAAANLVPQALTRSLPLAVDGERQTFSSSIKNIGTAPSVAGSTGRFCIDNANCATNPAGSFGTPSIPRLLVGAFSATLVGTWAATLGDHTAYFCVVGNTCTSLAFTVAPASGDDCSLDGHLIPNHTTHRSFNTIGVPAGQTCLDADNSGTPLYYQDRTCTDGTLSGNNSYSHWSCVVGAFPTQSDISLSADRTLVRKGEPVYLTWSGGNSSSCTLAGTNGFSSAARVGTHVGTTAITQKTTFTLTCRLGPSSKVASVSVNLVPTVIEI